MLLWMMFFRISLYEFNELDNSKRHALRRHYWSGLVWRFLQPFLVICILIVGCARARACACARVSVVLCVCVRVTLLLCKVLSVLVVVHVSVAHLHVFSHPHDAHHLLARAHASCLLLLAPQSRIVNVRKPAHSNTPCCAYSRLRVPATSKLHTHEQVQRETDCPITERTPRKIE